MDFITNYSWLVWLALILVFLIVEMFTLEFTFLMIAIGSLGGLLSGLFGLSWWAQIIVAAVLALILLFFVRPPLIERLKKGADPAKTLIEALIGSHAIALADFVKGSGQVKTNAGETWTARRLAGNRQWIKEGDTVEIVEIEGATAIVVSTKKKGDKK